MNEEKSKGTNKIYIEHYVIGTFVKHYVIVMQYRGNI